MNCDRVPSKEIAASLKDSLLAMTIVDRVSRNGSLRPERGQVLAMTVVLFRGETRALSAETTITRSIDPGVVTFDRDEEGAEFRRTFNEPHYQQMI